MRRWRRWWSILVRLLPSRRPVAPDVPLTPPEEHRKADEQLQALKRRVERAERFIQEYRAYDEWRRQS